MRKRDELTSQGIGLSKQDPEQGADQPGNTSHEQRQQREGQCARPTLIPIRAWLHLSSPEATARRVGADDVIGRAGRQLHGL